MKFKSLVRSSVGAVLGTHLRAHRIPFGPIRGQIIYTSPQISPRVWFGIDEPWIARISANLVKPAAVIYDIGANIGYTTVVFARQLKGIGVIHAFEILPSTVELLRKTVELNGLSNVTIHPVGLAAEEATLELPVGSTAMTSLYYQKHEHSQCELCRVVTLDAYCRDENLPLPDLIKIDIEGAEIDCLHGSRELIDKCRPTMIIAFHSKSLLQRGYELLTSLDYELYSPRGPVTEPSIARIRGYFNDSILCKPREQTA